MSGKAGLGTDYRLSGTAGKITIPAGQSSASITLTALTDNLKEKKETAIITIAPGTGYKVGGQKKATLNILD
jgi:hypothetical protein